jgi:hypothetical protein
MPAISPITSAPPPEDELPADNPLEIILLFDQIEALRTHNGRPTEQVLRNRTNIFQARLTNAKRHKQLPDMIQKFRNRKMLQVQ